MGPRLGPAEGCQCQDYIASSESSDDGSEMLCWLYIGIQMSDDAKSSYTSKAVAIVANSMRRSAAAMQELPLPCVMLPMLSGIACALGAEHNFSNTPDISPRWRAVGVRVVSERCCVVTGSVRRCACSAWPAPPSI